MKVGMDVRNRRPFYFCKYGGLQREDLFKYFFVYHSD